MSTEWIIYLIGCAVSFLAICIALRDDYRQGCDITTFDVLSLIALTPSSWVGFFCFIIAIFVDDDKVLIKGKE